MPSVKTFATIVATSAIVVLSSTANAQTSTAAQANPAAEHLTAARAALNKVLMSPAPSGDAFTKMSQVKTEYLALEKAASTASPQWAAHYQTINTLLTDLLGPAPTAGEPGAAGTSGSTAAKPMDPVLTANLLDFRTHLTAFSKAMAAVAPPPPGAAPAAAPSTATPPTAPETPAPATMPAATDASAVAQLDQVVGMIDGMLKASAAQATGTVSVERSTLEQIKSQLEQVRASVKKQ
jgi:hypothetical protein